MAAVVFAAPLIYLLIRVATGDNGAVEISTLIGPLARSLSLAVAVAATAMVLGTLLAWLAIRTDLPARRMWLLAAALPLAIPSYVAAAGLRSAFGQGGLIEWIPRPTGFLGALTVLAAVTYPYVYLPVAARLSSLSQGQEDAARLLGDRPRTVVRRIVLPQLRRSILGGGLIAFLYAISDFGAVSLLRFDTVTRVIYSSRLTQPGVALTLGLTLATLAMLLAFAENRGANDAPATVQRQEQQVYSLGRYRIWATGLMVGLLGVVVVVPIAVFVFWWMRGAAVSGLSYNAWWQGVLELGGPALNSAVAGVFAAGAAIVVLLPVVYLEKRGSSIAAIAARVAIASAFAVPGLVLALSLVYFVLQGPSALDVFYQTMPLLIIVYVIHFGIQSHRATSAAVQALPERYAEAASLLGAGKVRRFLTIDVPLILPGALAGGGLVMLSTMKELPATLLLAPIGFDTLATKIWSASEEGFLGDVGSASIGLMLVSGVLTWLLVLRPMNLTGSPRPSEARS